MTPYKNISGDSGVESYAINETSIHVRFKYGERCNYLYDHVSPGADEVKEMKKLAVQGRGLSAFIATTVGSRFSKRW